ncbi:MAG: amino acid adenylation domain-containing protein [Hassallia sp. WJT32-NPBG1]|jgi:amino acid adenylation domain-containing protein|nr:amino acid adenylation domain-containing protein [Hassallia sp. WJT32-NPBG1]
MDDFSAYLNELSSEKRELLELLIAESGSQFNCFPLSFAQQRLWFVEQLNPNTSTYNIFAAVQLSGLLNLTALHESLNEIVRRHEALRTTFATLKEEPMQIIVALSNVDLPKVDLRHLPKSEQEIEVQRLAIAEAEKPFDLSKAPLIRITLLQLSETEHVLLLVMHHIISDGWSIGVFLQEVAALYSAFLQGKTSPLPELPIQYADFAHWQREWLQGEVLAQQLSYWQQQLGEQVPVLELPTDRPRPPVQSFRGARQQVVLPQSLTEALKALSYQEESTLFMTLLSAFKVLLYRYSGQENILVGTPIANRMQAETEGLIGCFVNTLALRTDLEGNPSFRELLRRVRVVALGAYAHQNLPFEKLVEVVQSKRDFSRHPLFQVMFALQNTPMPALELPGLALRLLDVDSSTAKFDLTLELSQTAEGLLGWFEYNTDLFDAATMARMAGHFQILLEEIVKDPQQCIQALPMLTAAEQHQLLIEWNDTNTQYPLQQCVHELFAAQVERTPDAVAVVFEREQITYRELNNHANQVARYLQKLGVEPEVCVGICVERSPEMLVGLLGILKAGGAYVPLDPQYPQERLTFILEDTQVPVLLTQQHLVEGLPKHKAQVLCLDTDWEEIAQESEVNLNSGVRAENLAYVIYTSGSTGQPKGVLIDHKGLLNLVFWHQRAFKVTSLDRATQLAGTAFDAAVWELWPYLTAGASVYLVQSQILSSLVNLRDWLISNKITISFLPTPLAQELLSLEWPTESLALRTILTGGDKLHHYPSDSIPFQVVNNYGPTENTVVTTSGVVIPNEQNQTSPTIGRAIANTQVYILDQNLQPVPVGVPGELHIAGVGLTRGYLNRPELTQEKFIPNPFSTELHSRLYKTGDLVRYLPDGNIEYIGRIDNQVKIRGFRIELGEIEAVLAQHPAVRTNVVMLREDVPGNKRLVTYVVLNQEQAPTHSELRSFLKERLPDYMLPSAFVFLEALPLTLNGKINRHQLPVPDNTRQEWARPFVAPRNSVEEMLAQIWAEILQIEQVSIDDNFFELGGHSLLATQLIYRVQKAFQVELSLRSLFEAPTIAGLAIQIIDKQVDQLDSDNLLGMLAELEQLSNDEVQKILSKEK